MSDALHSYTLTLRWTGNTGEGTKTYQSYQRDYDVSAEGKPVIAGSADPNYRGDATRWNPEELLVASLSACHKLWFLHLAATAKIVVTDYVDAPVGSMRVDANGGGQFTACVLMPTITLENVSDSEKAQSLHAKAHAMCFIARSVNFPVTVEASYCA
ncbi:MAG: OsmC family protein [Pseudomonadota bacterium]